MDNFQKALQMGAAAFMFVIASSVAIILYTIVINTVKDIIVVSDNNTYSSEYAINNDGNFERNINKDEIIFTILHMKNEDSKSYIDKIQVVTDDGNIEEFDANDSIESIMSDLGVLNLKESYTSEYNFNNKILKYR